MNKLYAILRRVIKSHSKYIMNLLLHQCSIKLITYIITPRLIYPISITLDIIISNYF